MSVLSAFTDHLMEFIDDILNIFPDNHDIKITKNSVETIRKINPRKILMIWKEYVAVPYQQKIQDGDISFFIHKSYDQDIQNVDNQGTVLQAIERMREPVRQMGKENQKKAMQYIQNLTKLSMMY